MTHKLSVLAALTSLMLAPSHADTMADIGQAITEGKAQVMLRYRTEYVDQEGINDTALASTLLSRFSFDSGSLNGLSVHLEADNVTSIGGETYNSTVNGNTLRPVVADPTGTEVNQAYLAYQASGLTLSFGRQRINHDTQRFVGGVSWRQNEQTFDGYRLQYQPMSGTTLDYSYVYNVNRIFGEDSAAGDLGGDLHLLHASHQLNANHKLNVFGYWLDFDTAAALSTQTMGFGYEGKFAGLILTASLAQQQEHGDSSKDYSADYHQLELSGPLASFSWKLGYEFLGADNDGAFITPLATLHKFQGFTDKFLNTPADGIEDIYAGIGTKLAGVKLDLSYHQFDSDRGSKDYGDEWNISAAYAINAKLGLLVKYAAYSADDLATDTDKLWLMLTVNL
ncbi:alginate export family protein [Aliiglaciecola sp. CAU 1673]|uniref:alginate export family protein n=1 Tax=Aliiglaciecola sp. CAU 1673 TaxID=3032595 RepID=UPI0023DC5135|nr:alginate export family protein [Aliiglaciecola sp. CAU 1673]MDF2177401.1 alginate export family protein [Aliiglaciecola sp. CAU 1673]